MTAHDLAKRADGMFLLRMEDIDRTRARPEWEAQIEDDLAWLGLDWPRPVMRQSNRMTAYSHALNRLSAMGLTYACTCNRRDIREAASAPQEGAIPTGPDGIIYPGTCKHAGHDPEAAAIRLHIDRALDRTGPLYFEESGPDRAGRHAITRQTLIEQVGDVVLSRRDMGTSYHLAVVVDDAAQDVTHVVRGLDLFDATPIHVLLQRLLDLPTPVYHHHRLIRDESGKRLAKRDDARAIAAYRAEGCSPADIRERLGLIPAP